MTQPSFNPKPFLGNIGPYNPNTNTPNPSAFTYAVDPSADASGVPYTANIGASNAEYAGLYDEWLLRSKFGDAAAGANDEVTFQSQLNRLFARWSDTNTNPTDRLVFPRTWGDFISQFRNFFGINNAIINSGPAFDGFLARFKDILKTTDDWGDLSSNTINAEFIDSFAGFLGSYPFNTSPVGTVPPPPENLGKFLNNWRHFGTVVAVIDPNTALTNTTSPDYSNVLSYKEAYKAFFPNASDAEFTAVMQTFQAEVNNDTKNGGYFIPSQHFERFFQEIKNKLLIRNAVGAAIQTGSEPKLEIIWEIFATIVNMINVIQKTTAISAQRLGFLTNYQKAYTELIAQIPTLLNSKPFDKDTTGPLNAKLQAFGDSLRSFRGIVTDDSKALQSSVNGLNESSTQQANLATDLLQQMSSLLSTIMK